MQSYLKTTNYNQTSSKKLIYLFGSYLTVIGSCLPNIPPYLCIRKSKKGKYDIL